MIRFSAILFLMILSISCQQKEEVTEKVYFSNQAPEDAMVYFISPKDGDVVDTVEAKVVR